MRELTNQNQTKEGGGAMKNVEIFHLCGEDVPVSVVPWKFSVEDFDWFWPTKWLLYPITDMVWLVKRISPNNEYAMENYKWVGIKVDGELVFKTQEWNNEIVEIWSREAVMSLFEKVMRGEYSGVLLAENCDEKEVEEAEKLHRWLWVVEMLLEDKERISGYGEITFSRYIDRYYSRWIGEFEEFFKELTQLEGKERVRLLEKIRTDLEKTLFEKGYFMYVYYP